MRSRITELSCKEVINVCDGTRYGYVNDVEVDCSCGKILSLVVHSNCKCTPFFSKKDDVIIPWEDIKCIGSDIILVDFAFEKRVQDKKINYFENFLKK